MARGIGVVVAAALLTSACAAGQQAQTADEKSVIDGQNQTVGTIDLRNVAVEAPPSLQRSYAKGTDAQLTFVAVNNGRSTDRLVGITSSVITDWAAFTDYNDAFAVQRATSAEVTGTSAPSSSEPVSTTPAAPSTAPSTDGVSGSESSSESSESSSGAGTSPAPSTSPATTSAAPLPTGTQSVTIPTGGRVSYGTPEATGGILIKGLTQRLFPGTTIKVTFTFAKAGAATFFIPVQVSTLGRTAEVEGGESEAG